MKKTTPRRPASQRAQHSTDFDPGALHDDALIGSAKAARFLGLPDSTFFLIRKKMGRNFPHPVITCGRPRYRVGSLREWMRRLENANGGGEP